MGPIDRLFRNAMRHGAHALVMALLMGSGSSWGQHGAAATEAESGEVGPLLQRGDIHRDDDLGLLSPMDGALLGAEHLRRFLKAWDALLFETAAQPPQNGPLQVIHFGGSHVQAGRIGWSFRQRLAEDRPGIVTGCGIQPPHRLVHSNGPPERGWSSPGAWEGHSCAHRRHRAEWGITGVEARTDQGAPIAGWSGSPAGELCVSGIRILSAPDTASGWTPILPASWMSDLKSQETAGITQWWGPVHHPAPDTLTLLPSDSGPRALQGVEWVPEEVGFVFHDLGANGANSTSWMRNPHFSSQLRKVAPQLVILAWGINDAHMAEQRFDAGRFTRHYEAMIDTIRAAQPGADILLVTNNDSHYRHRHNPNAEAVRQAMFGLVSERGVACWDLYGHLGGKGAIDALHATGFAAQDRLHFRKDGYILIGELLYELLVRAALDQRLESP